MLKKDLSFERNWQKLLLTLEEKIGKKPADLNAVLFLIGVQELGKGPKNFSKEEKMNLMHIATCTLMSQQGFFEFEGRDKDGWPHFKQLSKPPHLSLPDQEHLLKELAMEYFGVSSNES